jgi:hypothetical protein
MNDAWIKQIESYHSGGLKVSIIEPNLGTEIPNLLHAISAYYHREAPIFLIFDDDNPKTPPLPINPSLENMRNVIESQIGSLFTYKSI